MATITRTRVTERKGRYIINTVQKQRQREGEREREGERVTEGEKVSLYLKQGPERETTIS